MESTGLERIVGFRVDVKCWFENHMEFHIIVKHWFETMGGVLGLRWLQSNRLKKGSGSISGSTIPIGKNKWGCSWLLKTGSRTRMGFQMVAKNWFENVGGVLCGCETLS